MMIIIEIGNHLKIILITIQKSQKSKCKCLITKYTIFLDHMFTGFVLVFINIISFHKKT